MKHPDTDDLALYAGGDLGIARRWRVARHISRCAACRSQVEAFQADSEWLADAGSQLPDGIGWSRLAGEMRANIQVGLAAGEAVASPEPESPRLGWRAAAALASITLVVVSGWWLHLPRPDREAGDILLAATSTGIELTEQDSALTLMHSASDPVLVTVSVRGSMTARFVDDETGMITINNVYAEE